jgi:hypothetical protein
MMRPALGLSLLVAALACARWASRPTVSEPSLGYEPLIEAERLGELEVAGFSVEYPALEQRFLFALQGGVWRCIDAHGALALGNRIEELTRELGGAIGELRSVDASRAGAYGLDSEDRITLRLHGPLLGTDAGQDERLRVEVGSAFPGTGSRRSWVRVDGSDRILEIPYDPRVWLERESASALPPLLDERLLAGEWPPRGGGLRRVFLDRADGSSLQLDSEVEEVAGLPREEWPRRWQAAEGEARSRCLPFRIAGWQAFLYRAPYVGLSDPAVAERRGLDEIRATLTLIQVDGDPITLEVGRPAPSGATFVRNQKTGQLCLLEPEVAALLVPTLGQLCEPEGGNPWESYLPR